jgi:hypothetical protein
MTSARLLSWFLLLGSLTSWARGQPSTYDPAARHPAQPHDSFIDFALKQINPQNLDYGCRIDEARQLALDETVKNIATWAALVALTFLLLSLLMLLHQHRERNRREVIAAEFLAQYHNALVDAHKQVAGAVGRYNQLAHTINSSGETGFRSPLPSDIRREAQAQSALTGAARSHLKIGEVDLIAQIGTLQQQLNTSHEREKNLQKELSKVQRSAAAKQSLNAGPSG